MARVSTHLNFGKATQEAFDFYRTVFGGEFTGGGIMRFGDLPPMEGFPPIPESEKNLIMHIEFELLGGHILMGADAPESMGFVMNYGNNVTINLEPDSREETSKLFMALSEGGRVIMPLQDMFWGAFYGNCVDKFGVQWMFNCPNKE